MQQPVYRTMVTCAKRMGSTSRLVMRGVLTALVLVSAPAPASEDVTPRQFTIAVIPDTQNYVDHTHQRVEGFPFDAEAILTSQMREIEARLPHNGGDIAFVTALGDVWQHGTEAMDPAHVTMGLKAEPWPAEWAQKMTAYDLVASREIPAARRAYQIIDGRTPFSVVPGNHDYDAFWLVAGGAGRGTSERQDASGRPTATGHFGGLRNWTGVFGSASPFFKGKDWYVDSFNGGADSAQIFQAGGYRFLHLGLEMGPADDVLAWANKVVAAHPGMPVIVTMHDYLNPKGERKPHPGVRVKDAHPGGHNDAEDIWNKFISRNPSIFLVLCGHQAGESMRVDQNAAGFKVHQILADYQERRQTIDTVADASVGPEGMGDGWMRFLTFDFSQPTPVLRVRTYSTYYHAYSRDLPNYASWYKPKERPDLSDSEFIALGDFDLPLEDFKRRFGQGMPSR